MTLYEVLALLHILAAITWVGGGLAINVLSSRIHRAGGPAVAAFTRQAEWMGKVVFTPASIAVLALGLWMVAENEAWTIGQLWIVLGLVGIGITAVTGAAFFGPETARISKMVESRGPEDPEVQRRIRRILIVGRFDLVVLLLIVVDMVLKPGV